MKLDLQLTPRPVPGTAHSNLDISFVGDLPKGGMFKQCSS